VASEFLRDLPVPVPEQKELWGSDAIAAMLRALDIPYLALNPGASYRGLHDSIVNYLGNDRPQMLLCLHEESAVAIAHGYAKASGRMMGAVLHSNVGLMHGSMAIFNAWCDRVPMLILGATGPWDAARRRPWIDWIHTASDQGALVRDYTKWDNQPASVPAAYEALMRAAQMANTAPRGPTYINLDAALQEAKIGPLPPLPDVTRFRAPPSVFPGEQSVKEAAQLLSAAKNPAMLIGRVSRDLNAWKARVALAEKLQAKVFTDIKTPAAFPTDHPLHAAPPATFPDGALLRECDVVLLARLGRHRGHAEGRVGRCADRREGEPRLGRCPCSSRLELGLPGASAVGCLLDVRARRGRAASHGCRAYTAGRRFTTGRNCV
jgi:thiamine pyrophosphate-dependent acetolactate synthase large subunit-like protein